MRTAHLVWSASAFLANGSAGAGAIVALNGPALSTLRRNGIEVMDWREIHRTSWLETNLEIAAGIPKGLEPWANFVTSEIGGAHYLWRVFCEAADLLRPELSRLYLERRDPLREDVPLACTEAFRSRGVPLEVTE